MNPWTISALADSRARELRRDADTQRIISPRPGCQAEPGAGHWPALRRRVGFRLVEAGLHVLATTRPAP
jgi:hypothetical protein